MVVALPIGLMNYCAFAERNYEKHLADAQEWIEGEERQKHSLGRKRKRYFDAMQVLSMKLIPYLLQWTNPFTSLGFGLGTNWFEREIQRAILQIRWFRD